LSHEKVDEAWAQKYLQGEDVEHRIGMEIYKVRTKYGVPELLAFLMNPLDFVGGTAYKIAPESTYAELKYSGKTRLTFEESRSFVEFLTLVADIRQPSTDQARVRNFLTGMASSPYTLVTSDLIDYWSRGEAATKNPETIQSAKVEKFFNFEASLSVRIEKEKLISWQVDDIRLTETDDVPDALKRLP